MYDQITERGRAALRAAYQEAHNLHHNYVRTEHLLLAILGDAAGAARTVLLACGVDIPNLRKRVQALTTPWTEAFISLGDHYPLTPPVQRVLLLSFEEAQSLGHDYVCTEHLLLGMLQEVESLAARVLGEFGVTADRARRETASYQPHFTR